MIEGDTGTGKDVLARYIHAHSPRSDRPFTPVDCTTLTEELFASQLFGHVKGAFTGAEQDAIGFFRAADGGTVFLDEIGELPVGIQAKLLRVLETSEVVPLGSWKTYPVDVRVIAASNRDLKSMVAEGSFRSDLYYRINVVSVHLPALRERVEDILPLAEHFLCLAADLYSEPVKRLSAEAQDALQSYVWEGNVRQLANAMERAHALTAGEVIDLSALPPEIASDDAPQVRSSPLTLEEANRDLIIEALHLTGGRKKTAARLLGIDRRRLQRMIERFGLTPSEYTRASG